MSETTRPATGPLTGGARETLVGAISGAAGVFVFSKTGSPELAAGTVALVQGILTFLRKGLMDRLA